MIFQRIQNDLYFSFESLTIFFIIIRMEVFVDSLFFSINYSNNTLNSNFHHIFSFQASSDGNATVSILAFPPKMEHIGKRLLCKASNPLIKQSEIMDGMKLNIDCKYCYCFVLFSKKCTLNKNQENNRNLLIFNYLMVFVV